VLPGWDHPSVYPTIDPKVHYDAQTFANKVVLITGASRGIGAQIALQYAHAGASLTLVARTQAALDASKNAILRERPSAQVLTFPTDVRDVKRAEEAVAATVARFGRLDILVANAGALRPLDKRAFILPARIIIALVADLCRRRKHSPRRIRTDGGIFLKSIFVGRTTSSSARFSYTLFLVPNAYHLLPSFAVPELLKTKGQVVILGSGGSQLRVPNASEYCISKHAMLRFAEFVTIGGYYCFVFDSYWTSDPRRFFVEYPGIKVFTIHPGSVKTDMYDVAGGIFPVDSTVELAASTIQYLTSGKADYLSGRYVSVQWDLGVIERDWKEKIIAQNGLVSKLSIPV
jgi:NAD(P)-dependent dehydrogenase (short-subunit alcohol dehydrogenase family)